LKLSNASSLDELTSEHFDLRTSTFRCSVENLYFTILVLVVQRRKRYNTRIREEKTNENLFTLSRTRDLFSMTIEIGYVARWHIIIPTVKDKSDNLNDLSTVA